MSPILLVSLLLMPSVFGIKLFIGKRDDNVDYGTANTRCSSLTVQGQLATFKSVEEYNAIAQIRADLGVNDVWVGLDDIDKEGQWKFVDNDDSFCGGCDCDTLSQWLPNEPNDFGNDGEDCAVIWANNGMNDVRCDLSLAYVCEITDSDAAVAGRAGTYFIGVNEAVTYATAKSRCSSLTLSGGHLATWGSQDEFNKIAEIRGNLGVNAWIGLDDLDQEDVWKFVDGDDCGGNCKNLNQWINGQPDNHNGLEDCAEVVDTQLNDGPCASQLAYICEFNKDNMAIGGVAIYDRPVGEPQVPQLPQLPVSNEPNNNYYILEFTSMMDLVNLVSYLLNVLLLTGSCCFVMNAFKNKSSGYSQVKMYATEDEKL